MNTGRYAKMNGRRMFSIRAIRYCRIPAKDAAGVAKLKEPGAIIVGKMYMHKLGMGTTGLESYFGPVHNPWDPEYIPGGSSSGSAAAGRPVVRVSVIFYHTCHTILFQSVLHQTFLLCPISMI